MSLYPSWQDIGLRLLLTLLAAAVIGLNREARGHAVGLRTTILVSLAACVAMIQANILLPLGGKTAASFGVMDLMRLPLGILTGVGFIGAGTILRRGDLVTGVTIAATLWVVTVIGLCFGGGQLALGGSATVITVLTLWALVTRDVRIPRDHRALLLIRADLASFSTDRLAELIAPLGCNRIAQAERFRALPRGTVLVRDRVAAGPSRGPLELLRLLNERYTVISFELTSDSHV